MPSSRPLTDKVSIVDQPAGTGYSYASTDQYVHTMDQAVEQLMVFLGNFYKVFPEYQPMDVRPLPSLPVLPHAYR